MAKEKEINIESVLDLNASNIWSVEESDVARMWEEDKKDEGFEGSEAKLLNVLRLAFEVVHFNIEDKRDEAKYMNGEWAVFSHVNPKKGYVAIRKKFIKRITDLSYENVKHITAATLLELIDRNFGGGWESIPLSIKDVIESAFDITTSQLPTSRLHIAGGTLERRLQAGYEVLEVQKGSWTEAIFAKKKEILKFIASDVDDEENSKPMYDEEGNLIVDDEELAGEDIDDEDDDAMGDDDTPFFSAYTEEAAVKDVDEEGFPIEDMDE